MNKATVVLILVDGFRHDYLNPADAPFLHALAQQNIDAKVRETFAFELRPAFFAGLHPEECDIANMFCFNPADSPFRAIDVGDQDRARISEKLQAEAARRGYSLVKHIGSCAEIPLPLLKYFDFAEKYHTADPGSIPGHQTLFDILRRNGREWLWIGYPDGGGTTGSVVQQFADRFRGTEDFIYLHFSELDWVGHANGPHSAEQRKTLSEIDAAIRTIFRRLNQSFAGVRSVIFGDHGQVAVTRHIDIEAKLQACGLVLENDYVYFLDSTQARFWFFNDAARQRVTAMLSNIPEGRILTAADRVRLHARFNHNRFGELVFVVHDQVGIFPNFFQHDRPCRGLHGYLPEVEGNWAKLIVAGGGVQAAFNQPVEMVDLYPTLLELLGCRMPAEVKAQSVLARGSARPNPETCAASVIVPTYNRLATLRKCLAALERQTAARDSFELIVIDDGSTDGTDDFLRGYSTRLNYLHLQQRNAGPAAARNLGIRHAAGHIIILIGDDIIVEPDFVASHCAFHREYPQAGHACLGFIEWSEDIQRTVLMDLLTAKDGGLQFCWPLVESQDRDNISPGFFWTSNLSFKRSFSLTHGLFAAAVFRHAVGEDVELGHRLHDAGMVLHFRKELRVYHEHAVTFRDYVERQKLVGWYSHDLFARGVDIGSHFTGTGETCSPETLNAICATVAKLEAQSPFDERLREIYNFGLRYAVYVGYQERRGKLPEGWPDTGGLPRNLARAGRELAACDRQISDAPAAEESLYGRLARKVFARGIRGKEIGVYIFGTGLAGRYLGRYLAAASPAGNGPFRDFLEQTLCAKLVIRGYFDNNPAAHGVGPDGVPVTLPAAVGPDDYVIIASRDHEAAMRAQMHSAGVGEDQLIAPADWLVARLRAEQNAGRVTSHTSR